MRKAIGADSGEEPCGASTEPSNKKDLMTASQTLGLARGKFIEDIVEYKSESERIRFLVDSGAAYTMLTESV